MSKRCNGMKNIHTCDYCKAPAVAYRLESDGSKTYLCCDHIPVNEGEELPELRSNAASQSLKEPR